MSATLRKNQKKIASNTEETQSNLNQPTFRENV